MIRKRLIPALAIGGLLAMAAPSASAVASTYVSTGAIFNNPKGPQAEQNAILGHVGRLINGALPGSTIKISMYAFGSSWTADRLVEAHHRGVNVQVLVDDDTISEAWMGQSGRTVRDKLVSAFAETPPSGTTYGTSWFRVCEYNKPCLADSSIGGVNHNKFFLFSRTTGSGSPTTGVPVDDVVVQSSGNLTGQDLSSLWNDAMTVVDNQALYAGYTAYFDRLTRAQADKSRVKDYSADVEAGVAKAYFFPRASTDVVVNILNTVGTGVDGVAPTGGTYPGCSGNSAGHGTADGRTVIRIANGQISRPAVAQKLWEMADDGCYIDVVYGKLADYAAEGAHRETAYWLTRSTRLGKISLHRLDNQGLSGPATTDGTAPDTGSSSHTKYMVIDGSYRAKKDQRIVFTGSHTFTGMALTDNDETLLKYEDKSADAGVFNAYVANFRAQRAEAAAEAEYGGVW
ncbi:phospholipase D-like domain-containing protein [Streptomyces sp. NPDC008125]|uniref:phospholipase D-like domain-containing protein n=1 Tax=Streptomyces sp. NPDC008125 TaxID=3364811 RepID=UPI0036E0E7CF